jgi:hypothetical protein
MTWKSKSNPTTMAQDGGQAYRFGQGGYKKEMQEIKSKPSLHDFARMA